VGVHRKRNLAKVHFPRKVSTPDRAGGGVTFDTCLHENEQGGTKGCMSVCTILTNVCQTGSISISKLSCSYLCSPHRVDEICKFLCMLFLVISGYFEVMPLCAINPQGLKKVTWTLLWPSSC